MKKIIFCLLVLSFLGCPNEDPVPSRNESTQFAQCNSLLSECTTERSSYCLFGYKWGEDNDFSPTGPNALGPQSPAEGITFSFQEANGLVNTHRQTNLESKTFSSLPDCAKLEIRNALRTWEQAAGITFTELPENSVADLRFFVADIFQSGVGYPNYSESICAAIKGTVVIKENVRFQDCSAFYLFALHETGHALGLGHSNTANVMNPDFEALNLTDLQPGDLEGIIQLYGTP